MKILIIVKSKHQDNTLKLAEAMSEAAPATVVQLEDANNYNLNEYDVVGLGSGIFLGKHYKELIKFADTVENKYCFVFSTSGFNDLKKVNAALIKLLEGKGKTVLGSYACRGYFALLGKNKGHPDIDDFDNAQKFINEIIEKYNNQLQ